MKIQQSLKSLLIENLHYSVVLYGYEHKITCIYNPNFFAIYYRHNVVKLHILHQNNEQWLTLQNAQHYGTYGNSNNIRNIWV